MTVTQRVAAAGETPEKQMATLPRIEEPAEGEEAAPFLQARTIAVQLSCATRVVFQANRLAMGPLLVLMAAETGMSKAEKGRIMSAFPLGYLLTQIPGGRFADLYGGKVALNLALLATTLCTLVLPWTVGQDLGVGRLCAASFVMGLCQGPTFPTNSVLLSRWVPREEKSWASSISSLSDPLAGGIANLAVPALAAAFGWRTASTIFAAVTALFALLWLWLGADSPQSCSYITKKERAFLAQRGCGGDKEDKEDKGGSSSPSSDLDRMAALFKHPAVISTMLAHSVFNLARYFIYSWMPIFYSEVFGLDPTSIGTHLTIPEVTSFFMAVAITPLGDNLVQNGVVSPTGCRRLMSGGAFIFSGLALLLCGWPSEVWTVTAFMTVAQCIMCMHGLGFRVSYIELTKEFSGVFSGVGNTVATFATFAGPLLTAFILERYESWALMFFIILLFNMGAAIAYCAMISTECLDDASKKEE